MLGAGLQFNRSRKGEDRFYSAAKARRGQNQIRSYYHQSQSQDHIRRAQSDVTVSVSPKPETRVAASDEPPEESPVATPAPVVPSDVLPQCNLQRFVQSVTPAVPAQCLSKTTMRGLRKCDSEFQPYFVLGDLWEFFKEWSAYGAGVPLVLDEADNVIQYYVPYLSGIQLYGDPSKPSVKSRQSGEESDGEYFRDTSSDGSSDSENERSFLNHSREQWIYNHQTGENSLRTDHLTLRDQNGSFQEGFSSDEGEPGCSQGRLLFEYLERNQPYGREPLADKISGLALRFPELKTLRSCDLLPSSWISVAWYPIYRIPMGPSLNALEACFLTFHSLHTPMIGTQNAAARLTCPTDMDVVSKIPLPVFGLASYKFNALLWTPNGGCGQQLMSALLQSADNWLSLLQVNHPDYMFFCRR